MFSYANLLKHLHRFTEAEDYLRLTLTGRLATQGPRGAMTLATLSLLGDVLTEADRPAEGEAYLRQAFDGRRATRGENSTATLDTQSLLAIALLALGRDAEALTLAEDAVRRGRAALPENDARLGILLWRHGRVLAANEQWQRAEQTLDEAFGALRTNPSSDTQATARKALAKLIDVVAAREKQEPGAGHEEKAAKLRRMLGA
jgi:tetratricopeptide (TPR) repeat protein